MNLKIKTEKLTLLMKEKKWSTVELAKRLELDYSYVYRVLKGERNAGGKFFSSLLTLCKEEGVSFEKFVYINVKKKDNAMEKQD